MKTSEPKLNLELFKSSTLLYLEDDENVRESSTTIFERFFGKVIPCSDGQVGIEAYYKNKDDIDIVMTDISMPNISGLEFMKEVRDSGDWSLPILVITAFKENDILLQAIKLKVENYILKPMQLNTTLKIMNHVLEYTNNKKLIEKQARELSQFKDILDKQNIISETDLAGNITYANDIFCEVSGYTREELLGKPHNIVRHPDIPSKVYKELWDTIKSGKVWKGKLKNLAKDGSTYYVQATIFPIFDLEGNIIKYMASRFLITTLEEEKQVLKKYILSEKSKQFESKKSLEKEIEERVAQEMKKMHIIYVQKLEKQSKFIIELEDELKRIRGLKTKGSKHSKYLEDEIKELNNRIKATQQSAQVRMEKLNTLAKKALERHDWIKGKYEVIREKFNMSQETIRTLEDYIEEYRKKIEDLYDVIKSKEDDIDELKGFK